MGAHEFQILLIMAALIGFLHVLIGPDHYLPFIMMAKAGQWSSIKTFWITFLSGLAHILSSFFIGLLGIYLGKSLGQLKSIEAFRGELTAWALMAFGLTYFVWGLRKVLRSQRKMIEVESHIKDVNKGADLKPWILFTIFAFGPCESLIPFLMFPAIKSSMITIILVFFVFGIVTIGTMLGIVLIFSFGLNVMPFKAAERYRHAFAGAMICLCALAVKLFGL